MNSKIKSVIVLVALVLPLSWAGADVSFQFTDGASISTAPGQTVTLHLQLVATANETSTNVDYLLSQISGPGNNVFSIVGRDLSGSDYSDPAFTLTEVTNTDDIHPPVGPDNLLNPQNDLDLGATKTDTTTNYVGGTHYIATLLLAVDPTAPAGSYNIQTTFSTYGATNHDDLAATAASILINVTPTAIPEPGTWALLGLGGVGMFGLKMLRARRKS